MNLLDLFFPKKCVGCNRIDTYFCEACLKEIRQSGLVCPFCERPALGGITHPKCKRKYGLDGLWSLGIYQNPLRKAIQKIKYKWIKELAEILVNLTLEYWAKYQPLMLDQIKKDRGESWAVIPVPLHKSRQNWRGFNQSALIAQLFSQKTGLQYSNSLKRIKNTRQQVGLESYQRKQNIQGAFKLTENLKGKNILLIDDVWTTGSTLKECCYILKKGGAQSVWALTIAR